MTTKTNEDNEKTRYSTRDDHIKEDLLEITLEERNNVENKYEEEDIDIQVVNELATVKDDTSLPCYTVRVFVTGIVS